jgi:RNA polymerase sigma factor (sigma-70 family)
MSHRTALGLVLTWHDAARFADWPSEKVLEQYVASRDEAAFRELLRRHAPHVWAVCRRELRSPDLVEDAFQTTFVALVRKAHQVRQPGSLAGWLDRTARRAAGEIRRKAARQSQVEAAMPAPTESRTDDGRAETVRAAVAGLPEKYRLPIVYRYLSGLSAADVARVMGLPEETSRTRLKRGVELLRQKLGGKGLGIGVATAGGTVSMETALTAAAESVPQTVLAATAEAVRALPVKRSLLAALAGVVTYKRAVIGMTALAFGMAGSLVGMPGPKYQLSRVSPNDNQSKDSSMRVSPLLALAAGLTLTPKVPAQTFTKIADASTPVPGGAGTFASLIIPPSISGSVIAFTGSVNGSLATSGVYTGTITGGSLTRIADPNTPIPGGVVISQAARAPPYPEQQYCSPAMRQEGFRQTDFIPEQLKVARWSGLSI